MWLGRTSTIFIALAMLASVPAYQNCARVQHTLVAEQKSTTEGNGHGGYDGKVYVAASNHMTCADGDAAFARIWLDTSSGLYYLTRWNCRTRDNGETVQIVRLANPDEIAMGGRVFTSEIRTPAQAPQNLRYPSSSPTLVVGQAMATMTPSYVGTGTTFSVSPALPAGLSLNTSSGAISGTPTQAVAGQNYTVLASNIYGFDFAFLNLKTVSGFTVNSLGDAGDATPGDGVCATAGNACTLRAAIQESNASPTLARSIMLPAGTINVTAGEISIAANVEIRGAGASATILDAGNASRIFRANTRPNDQITLAEMALQNGRTAQDGGCMVIEGNRTTFDHVIFQNCRSTAGQGGALAVSDSFETKPTSLTIRHSIFRDNLASAGGGGLGLWALSGNATILDSSFERNTATDMGGGLMFVVRTGRMENSLIDSNTLNVSGTHHGGGGLIVWGGTYTLVNNTITRNTDNGGYAALHSNNNVDLTMQNNTIANNTSFGCGSPSAGALSMNTGGVPHLSGNIFNNNRCDGVPGNCGFNAAQASLGYNLSDTAASECRLTATGDRPSTAANLGPLQNNGGFTSTMALLAGSPGVDQGPVAANCPAFDQRGYPRSTGAGCDIGAHEGP